MLDGKRELAFPSFLFFKLGKTFQNLKVSSPAPVTTVFPQGLIAKYKTLNKYLIYRIVCPVKVAIFCILGKLQKHI